MKQASILLGVAATFTALARPLVGFRLETERREGIDLMFAVDTSKSMRAADLRPDRLTRAKLAVSDLVREFPGARVGLIAFAGEAFVQVPMTIDHAIFGEGLDTLDTDIIPRGGTNIASPILAAAAAMATEPDRRKVLVILSDGEDLQGEAQVAAKQAASAGLVIYTVGVGTQAGDLIPIVRDGRRDVLRDADGQPVRSRLDEPALQRLAQSTGGAYAALGPSGRGLETLYRKYLAHLPRRTVEERTHKIYTERFQIPLAVAIACLALELALGERRRRKAVGSDRKAGPLAAAERPDLRSLRGRPLGSAAAGAVAGLALLMAAASRPAAAAPVPPSVHGTGVSAYNDGTSAYRKNDFTAARDRFEDATHTTDVGMQADAYYDLGNSRYRLGQAVLPKDRQATIAAWKGAIASYDGAVALRPRDADARFNRDLVTRRLAALEEQQRKDQQKKSGGTEQNKKQGKARQPQSSSEQGQGKGKNDQAQSGKAEPGKGQPEQGQGSGQDSGGRQESNPQSGGKRQDQAAKSDQGQARDQTARQGSGQGRDEGKPQQRNGQGTEAANEPPESGAQPRPGSPDEGARGHEAAPSSSQSRAARQGADPDEQTAPQGPGIVSGPSGPSAGASQSAGARRDPGALSPSEALQLLDSVSGELRRLPVASARRQQPDNRDGGPVKDW